MVNGIFFFYILLSNFFCNYGNDPAKEFQHQYLSIYLCFSCCLQKSSKDDKKQFFFLYMKKSTIIENYTFTLQLIIVNVVQFA